MDQMKVRSELKSALVLLLKPLARFCLRHGLRLRDMADALKSALLQAANEELETVGQKANVSRLSLLTGLQRKDIKRIDHGKKKDYQSDLLSKIIGQWQTAPAFCTKAGKPRTLHVSGAASEFSELVRSVSADVSPYTVLFALEQAGLVKRSDDKAFLQTRLYLPGENVGESLQMLAGDIGDLINSVEQNVFEKPLIPNLHLTTVYDNISSSKAEELRTWILNEGTKFHEKLRLKLSKYDMDVNPALRKKEAGVRIAVGSFSYSGSDIKGEAL